MTPERCITDTGAGRIYWEWHEGRWVYTDEATRKLNRDPRLVDMTERAEQTVQGCSWN